MKRLWFYILFSFILIGLASCAGAEKRALALDTAKSWFTYYQSLDPQDNESDEEWTLFTPYFYLYNCWRASADCVTTTAKRLLEDHKKNNPQADQFWGMDVQSVFGPACPRGDVIGGLIHNPLKKIKDTDNNDDFQLTYHCWVKGKKEDKVLKQAVDVIIFVVKDAESGKMKVNFYLFETKPLSGWKQVGLWLFWGMIGSILMIYLIKNIPHGTGPYPPFTYGLIITLIYVGQLSYWTFGSGWAVIVGIIIYLISLYVLNFLFFFIFIMKKPQRLLYLQKANCKLEKLGLRKKPL